MTAEELSAANVRDEALFSLNEKRIKAYLMKQGVDIPDNQEEFWKAIHIAICIHPDAADKLKAVSAAWLYWYMVRKILSEEVEDDT